SWATAPAGCAPRSHIAGTSPARDRAPRRTAGTPRLPPGARQAAPHTAPAWRRSCARARRAHYLGGLILALRRPRRRVGSASGTRGRAAGGNRTLLLGACGRRG